MEQGLKKTLKLPQLIALAAGGMIAAWMVEIQYWFSLTGTGSLLALILCAVFVLPLCFIYAEMTTMLPYAGGENVWVSNAFGWNTGWVCCWFVLSGSDRMKISDHACYTEDTVGIAIT